MNFESGLGVRILVGMMGGCGGVNGVINRVICLIVNFCFII